MSTKMIQPETCGLLALLRGGGKKASAQRGCERFDVAKDIWRRLSLDLGKGLDLMGLWADADQVHMALYEPASGAFAMASLDLEKHSYPSVGRHHAAAIRPERAMRDLHGITPRGLPDTRPWLDHGQWKLHHPLKAAPDKPCRASAYPFLTAEGEGLHQIPVGPVHAGVIEPGHFRFTCAGETVVRLEQRLGYAHKGIEKLLQDKTPDEAARLCARISGDSTAAYSFAFARAVEAALEVKVPPRALYLRALMAELERLANHLGDIGAICNDAAFALLHAHFGILREDVLQASQACFGHRLMMDRIVPGGVSTDLAPGGREILAKLTLGLGDRLPRLVNVYDNTPSLQNRTRKSGILVPQAARRFAAGGFVGRASGRAFDVRKAFPYAPYESLAFDVPGFEKGDVDCRIWMRIHEVEQSLGLLAQILEDMPGGDIHTPLPAAPGQVREGCALVEGFRGDVLVWVRLDPGGRVAHCHPRDPSVFQWPLLEAVIEGNIIADFPLCNKSFNCSYSGHDL